MTYIIPAEPEDLRRSMIGYHEQAKKSALSHMNTIARTQLNKEFYRATAATHENMIDFWKNVYIGHATIKDVMLGGNR